MIQKQGCRNNISVAKYNRNNFYSLLLKLKKEETDSPVRLPTPKDGCLESLKVTANLPMCTACTLHLYQELISMSRHC